MAPKGQDKREQFWKAIKTQKLDTVRWGCLHGGQDPSSRNDDGFTAIQFASANNLTKALQVMTDIVRRSRELEKLDLTDGDGEGRTALMMAAANGHKVAVQELLYAGAKSHLKCGKGMTAQDYAQKRGHAALADIIRRGGDSESEGEDEEEGYSSGAEEGETSTQRSRRKKKELQEKEQRGLKSSKAAAAQAQRDKEEEDKRAAEAAGAAEAADVKPRWQEVEKALADGLRELIIEDVAVDDGQAEPVDPALWRCKTVNNLRLRLADRRLMQLPEGLGRLSGLISLVISNNGLTSLPDAIGSLPSLKILEASGNQLEALPEAMSSLSTLETLDVVNNRLTSLAPLAPLTNLVTVSVDGNAIFGLEDLQLSAKPRLAVLSARSNKIEAIPEEIGECNMLISLYLKGNAIEDVAAELSGLKKLKELELDDNPIGDPKIKKMMGKPATFVKDVLTYLKKNRGGKGKGGKGGKKGKGKKGKQAAGSDGEDDE